MYIVERLRKFTTCSKTIFSCFQCRKRNRISPRIDYKHSVICHSFFFGLSPIHLSDLLLVFTSKSNLRSSSDNRILCIHKLPAKHLGIARFLFQSPQYGILFLQNTDILILSRNLCQHKELICITNSMHDALNFVDLDVKHYIWSHSICMRLRDCESLTCEIFIFHFAMIY